MKKAVMLLVMGIILLGTSLFGSVEGKRPFEQLSEEDIEEVQLIVIPPGVETGLSEMEIEELVGILQDVRIYQEDNSYEEYEGQGVTFEISLGSGEKFEVMAYNPFLIINGIGYRTEYGPCEELNSLGNDVVNEREVPWPVKASGTGRYTISGKITRVEPDIASIDITIESSFGIREVKAELPGAVFEELWSVLECEAPIELEYQDADGEVLSGIETGTPQLMIAEDQVRQVTVAGETAMSVLID